MARSFQRTEMIWLLVSYDKVKPNLFITAKLFVEFSLGGSGWRQWMVLNV